MADRRKEERGEWELDSGLVDDGDIVVKKSRFGYLDSYQSGEAALLIWDVESPDAVFEYPIIWPLGSDWKVVDRGLRAEHPKRERFVKTSIYGRLIERVTKDLGVDMKSRGGPRTATIWEGLSFHVKREVLKFPGAAERGLKDEVEHMMPTEFLGEGGQKAATKTATKVKEATGDGDVVDRLTKLAKSLDNREKFQKAALNLSELNESANSALLSDVLEDSDQGFWARARKG